MEKFKDRLDREWSVEVDNSMLADLREAGLDLAKFPKGESTEGAEAFGAELMILLMDPEKLGNILSVLCQEQIVALELDARGFARGFNADALCSAADAVLLASFDHAYRRPELRKAIREKLLPMWKDLDKAIVAKLNE